MSMKRSTPAIRARPSTGRPVVDSVAASTTNETPGTPAMPLLVSIRTKMIEICCMKLRSMP
ncbi:hypothetical protein D3C78_1746500 [compost metagenome]